MEIKGFGVEEWLNENEKSAQFDISQSTISSLTLGELLKFDSQNPTEQITKYLNTKLNYGWIEGSPEFKQLVSELYLRVDSKNVLQTNGATGGNFLALFSLLNPGDQIISLYPSYQQLYDIPKSLGVKVDNWGLREDLNWQPDIEQLKQLISPKTKMICLNNAQNPTGSLLKKPLLKQVVALAREVGAYILADEVYQPVDKVDQFPSIADLYEQGISVNSLSKTYSVPGLRIGWIATQSAKLADVFRKYRDYTMISGGVVNDTLACITLRNRQAILARNKKLVKRNHEILRKWVDSQEKVDIIMPEQVSTACIKLNIKMDDETFCQKLLDDTGVLLVPGNRFDMPGHARVGYCTDTETLKNGLQRLNEFLKQCQ
ncbi:aminotransferase [Pediococcus damnosus]|uniref:aminotransferase n=1 Tax=Pediococcus damnosus TaxID=51663 RepID=UPI00078CB37B|nr:aminotransferase [Pediococcus damnosus]AMV70027.1 Aspartate aminotransferase [Pediococcus damnosus]PIO81712.1 aminotransferase [Pediococcus damnosus]PIO84732.1 aminotransferase [Pediococcus damnosus]